MRKKGKPIVPTTLLNDVSAYFPPTIVHDGYGYIQLPLGTLENQGFYVWGGNPGTSNYSGFFGYNTYSDFAPQFTSAAQDDACKSDVDRMNAGDFTTLLSGATGFIITITPFHGISFRMMTPVVAKKSSSRIVIVFMEDTFSACVFLTLDWYDAGFWNKYKVVDLDVNVYCTGSASYRNNLAMIAFNTFNTQFADFQAAFLH